jgi:hypothetical protein
MSHDGAGQRPGDGVPRLIVAAVEVALAGDAPDHHGFHEHESRPSAPDRVGQAPEIRMNSGQNILVENEEGLDGDRLAAGSFDGEIPVIEFGVNGVFDDFVVAPVLVLCRKCARPMPATPQLMPRNDGHGPKTVPKTVLRPRASRLPFQLGSKGGRDARGPRA